MENLIGAFIFIIVGGGFLYAGYFLRNSYHKIKTDGIKTRAKIVAFVEKKSKLNEEYPYNYHLPIVTFIDKDGVETTQELDSSENPKRINEMIDIIYLKTNSEYEIIIDSDFWKTYFPLIFIIGGFLFSTIGIVWLINK